MYEGVDFYYQRASTDVPLDYGKFISYIGSRIKRGGFLLLDNNVRHYDWHDYETPDNHIEDELGFTKTGDISSKKIVPLSAASKRPFF